MKNFIFISDKMEFFQQFSKTYNQVHKTKNFIQIIPPNEEEWMEFSKRLSSLTSSQKETIYLTILHYSFLTEKRIEQFPYGIKKKGNDLQIPYSDLPFTLQHILLTL